MKLVPVPNGLVIIFAKAVVVTGTVAGTIGFMSCAVSEVAPFLNNKKEIKKIRNISLDKCSHIDQHLKIISYPKMEENQR